MNIVWGRIDNMGQNIVLFIRKSLPTKFVILNDFIICPSYGSDQGGWVTILKLKIWSDFSTFKITLDTKKHQRPLEIHFRIKPDAAEMFSNVLTVVLRLWLLMWVSIEEVSSSFAHIGFFLKSIFV